MRLTQSSRITRALSIVFIAASAIHLAAVGKPGAELDAVSSVNSQATKSAPNPASVQQGADGRIKLDVVVTDQSGNAVPGLSSQDFSLLEDNFPRKIISFHASDGINGKVDPPVEVILVFDTVNNGFTELAFIRKQLVKFLRQNGGHLTQPVSIILFNAAGLPMQSPSSTDGNSLADMLNKFDATVKPRGTFPFILSLQALLRITQNEAAKPGRKMLIWLGQGWATPVEESTTNAFTPVSEQDMLNHFSAIVSLSTKIREARITLYGGYANSAFRYRDLLKGVRKVSQVDGRMLSLDVLALESGGRGSLTFPNRDNDLAAELQDFFKEASAYYTLSFDPPPTDHGDEYHDLKVLVDKPGMTAHTNTGYYNQPKYSHETKSESTVQRKPAPSVANEANSPIFITKRVSVDQLEQMMKGAKGKPDSETAKQLADAELTERVSAEKLLALQSASPGAKTSAALVAVADESAFLTPPTAEIPADAAPALARQRRIVALAVDYLGATIPKLPNFYATRITTRYESAPDRHELQLHAAGTSSATVVYRDGTELLDSLVENGKKLNAEESGMITRGTFGPILTAVMIDAAHGDMSFTRWEQGDSGPEAVFRFSVPKEKSHYEVAYRSPSGNDQGHDIKRITAYHGEVAINPTTGAILRLMVEADLDPGLSIVRADILVNYGAVGIGGKSYICPVKSISLSVARAMDERSGNAAPIPEITRLNDVVFKNYHLFRTEMRILDGDNAVPANTTPDPAPKRAPGATPNQQ